MRGFAQRILVGIIGAIALGAIMACPPRPAPPLGPPDASDGSIAPPATCQTACPHAVAVCPTVDKPTCLDICGREPPAYAALLQAAAGCPDVKRADPGAPATQGGTPGHLGR